MSAKANEHYWRGEAARVKRVINFAWWVERFNWLLVTGFLLLSLVLVVMRAEAEAQISPETVLIFGSSALMIAILGAWIWSRRYFIGHKEGLIRLDDQWSLNSQLVSAAAGQSPWPEAIERDESASPPWRLSAALLPSIVAVVALVLAWFVPIPEKQPDTVISSSGPKTLEQVEEWIETLEAEEWIEQESLDEIVEKIEELRSKPESEWFSHASLEAADTLKDSMGGDLRDMADDLAALERSLDALTTFSSDLSEAGKEMLMRELTDAMESLAANGLTLNEDLAKQLSEIDPSLLSEATLGQISPEDLQNLQQQLGECSQCLGSMEGLPQLREGDEMMSYKPGMMPGNGGISRGKGDAPIFFGDRDDLNTNQIEEVSNDDLSRAAVGDLLGIGETEHEDSEVRGGPQEGGVVDSAGSGGDAVWKDSLLPGEQAVLKRYFK